MRTATERVWTLRNLHLARNLICNAETIAISGHANPDGDSIGSLLSLGIALESLGKRVYMICADGLPKKYQSLPGAQRILARQIYQVDLAIAVDCGSKEMLGVSQETFDRARAVLEIDHHQSRISFGDVSLVDSEASSVGELVYLLLEHLEILITRDIAQNVLTSIIVETNSFRLPGIRPHTFDICANLLRTGVDFFKLAESVYWVTSRPTALLNGICLSRCAFSDDGAIAWSELTSRDLRKVCASESDADPVAEKIRSIQGVRIAILFREKNRNEWRVSLRSKDGINIAQLAEKFGGGGHLSAAGCTVRRKNKVRDELLQAAHVILDSHRLKATANAGDHLIIDAVTYEDPEARRTTDSQKREHCLVPIGEPAWNATPSVSFEENFGKMSRKL